MAEHAEAKQGPLLRCSPLARLRRQAACATSRAAPLCSCRRCECAPTHLARRALASQQTALPAERGADRDACGSWLFAYRSARLARIS